MKYVFFALLLVLTPFSFSTAQVDLSFSQKQLLIDIDPLYPEPNTPFRATINDASMPVRISGITWKINGVVVPNSDNIRSISSVSPEAGKTLTVEATAELAGGGTQSVKRVIAPIYLDLIVEAQTKTPSFYLGRGLPSVGSTINLTALVSGTSVPEKDLLYTWRVNNGVIGGGSLRGQNKTSFVAPVGQNILISVDVTKTDGEVITRRNIEIPSVYPTVFFYEVNSLYGLQNKPITNLSLIGSSATVRAEPYNLDLLTYNNPGLLEWELNNAPVTNTAVNPYELTLARDAGTGAARVDFHVRNLSQLLQGSKGSFGVNY